MANSQEERRKPTKSGIASEVGVSTNKAFTSVGELTVKDFMLYGIVAYLFYKMMREQ